MSRDAICLESIKTSLSAIAEILTICHARPDLSGKAKARLDAIISELEDGALKSPSTAKSRVHTEVSSILQSLKEANQDVARPTSVTYREIAEVLARRHELPYDPKTKRSEDLMRWFDAHWDRIAQDFRILLSARVGNVT